MYIYIYVYYMYVYEYMYTYIYIYIYITRGAAAWASALSVYFVAIFNISFSFPEKNAETMVSATFWQRNHW